MNIVEFNVREWGAGYQVVAYLWVDEHIQGRWGGPHRQIGSLRVLERDLEAALRFVRLLAGKEWGMRLELGYHVKNLLQREGVDLGKIFARREMMA